MADGKKKDDVSKKPPIGDPPGPKQPVRADRASQTKKPLEPLMMDPFTEQTTHPAGVGQGANLAPETRPEPKKGNPNDEETMPIEKGFSMVP